MTTKSTKAYKGTSTGAKWTGTAIPGSINYPELGLLMTAMGIWSSGKDKIQLLVNIGSYSAGEYTDLDEKLMLDIAETINDRIRKWLWSYEKKNPGHGFEAFKRHWKLLRTFVPLQFRLATEQVLYEKGQPWSSLITGFRPMDTD